MVLVAVDEEDTGRHMVTAEPLTLVVAAVAADMQTAGHPVLNMQGPADPVSLLLEIREARYRYMKNYAIINNGIVTNIIWADERVIHEFPNAVDIGDLPVQIGDAYDKECFFRDSVKIMSKLEAAYEEYQHNRKSLEEMYLNRIDALEAEMNDMRSALRILEVNVDG